MTLPVSKRLLNEVVTAALPVSSPIRELDVTPLDGDRFFLQGRVGSSPILPPFQFNVAIDRQPEFPDVPVLVLRLESMGLRLLAGLVLRKVSMPSWVHVDRDRIHVDLRVLADQNAVGQYVGYIEHLRVNTVPGTLMLSLRARIR